MKIIPFARANIIVNATSERCMSLLDPHIDQAKFKISKKGNGTFFIGDMNKNGFKIFRNSDNRNSFVPILIGSFHPTGENKTNIIISGRMSYFVIIFMMAWLSFVGYSFVNQLIDFGFCPFRLIIIFAFILGWAVMCSGFWREWPKSLNELRRLVNNCNQEQIKR